MSPWKAKTLHWLMQATLQHRPFLQVGERFPGVLLVSRRDDVLEVFRRDREFSVAPYGVRMKSCIGPAVLGMDDGPAYRHELGLLRAAVLPDDMPRIRALAEALSQELVGAALRHKPWFDLVSELGDPLALRYVEDYFGVPDPGHGVLLRWFRMMSYYVFNLYLATGPRVEIPTVRACARLLAHVEAVVAARRQEGSERDDVLGRLLVAHAQAGQPFSDADVARRLTGLISGSIAAPFWLAVNVFEKLLNLPAHQLEGARQAARHGEDDVVEDYVLEAARFSPVPGVVWRYCESDARLAEGTAREQTVAAGTLLGLVIIAANRDPNAVPDPDVFRVGRGPEQRLLFGHSLHYCFADYVGKELMTQMAKVVLAQPGVRKAPGLEGTKQSGPKGVFPEGMFPARLVVQVDTPR